MYRVRSLIVLTLLCTISSAACWKSLTGPTPNAEPEPEQPPRPAITDLTFRYSCTYRTSPFWTMTCTGTADFGLNVTVTTGRVLVTMAYGNDSGEAPFRGTANVSTRQDGPGQVHIANFALNNYTGPCLPQYSSVFRIWDGVLNDNPRLLGSVNVTGTTTCP